MFVAVVPVDLTRDTLIGKRPTATALNVIAEPESAMFTTTSPVTPMYSALGIVVRSVESLGVIAAALLAGEFKDLANFEKGSDIFISLQVDSKPNRHLISY